MSSQYHPHNLQHEALSYTTAIQEISSFTKQISIRDKTIQSQYNQTNHTHNKLNITATVPIRNSATVHISDTQQNDRNQFNKHKKLGNELFIQNKYSDCIDHYTQCTVLVPDDITGWANRSQCYLKQDQYIDAINDCTQALTIDKKHVKSLYRRAYAYKQLHDYVTANNDITTLLSIDSHNKQGIELQQQLNKLLSASPVTQTQSATKRTRVKIKSADEIDDNHSISIPSSTHTDIDQSNQTNTIRNANVTTAATPPISTPSVNPPLSSSSTLELLAPHSVAEFQRVYRSIRKNIDQLAQYIELIDVGRYNTMFMTTIDGQFISDILNVWKYIFDNNQNKLSFISDSIRALTHVNRFNVASMMLDSTHKQILSTLLNAIASQQISSPQQLNELADKYHVKLD